MTETENQQIEQVRELTDISEYRIYEHMGKFHPQLKYMLSYKDNGEPHPTNATKFVNVFHGLEFETLESAELEFDKFLTKPIYHQKDEQPNHRVFEHMDLFYPQYKKQIQFEAGQEIHPIYKEVTWFNCFEQTANESFATLEEAQRLLEMFMLEPIIHPYTKKNEI